MEKYKFSKCKKIENQTIYNNLPAGKICIVAKADMKIPKSNLNQRDFSTKVMSLKSCHLQSF